MPVGETREPPSMANSGPDVLRPNLPRIRRSLERVKKHFPEINGRLNIRRDDFDDEVCRNMILAYELLDQLVVKGKEPFVDEGFLAVMEMNNLVLCGPPTKKTGREYRYHLQRTRERFMRFVTPIQKWYLKHVKKGDSAPKVAAEVYVGILSRPQLFIEGNHRTGALIASWILLLSGRAPFVLTVDNAEAYFNPSSQIKLTDKLKINGKLKLPRYKKRFKRFLLENISEKHAR
jgi:hypothetical protein